MPTAARRTVSRPLARKPSGVVRCALAYAAAALVVQAEPQLAYGDDWSSLGLDGQRSRRSHERSGTSFDAGGWRYQVAAPLHDVKIDIASSPAVADGFVVFASLDGTVQALRAADGKAQWRFAARDGIVASPAVSRGRVFISSFDRTLYALRLTDGHVLWSRSDVGISHASPTLVSDAAGDGLLLMTGYPERRLIRFDAATGTTVWETPEGKLIRSGHASVAVGDGLAVVGIVGGHYEALEVATGKTVWTYEAPGSVHLANPLIAQDLVLFAPGGDSGKLHAVHLKSGQPVLGWPVTFQGPETITGNRLDRNYVVSSPVFSGGHVLLQIRFTDSVDTNRDTVTDRWDVKEVLASFDVASGKQSYELELASVSARTPEVIPALGILPTPAIYRDGSGNHNVAIASSIRAQVKVVRAATGAVLWTHAVSAPTRSSPVFANGRLYLGVDNGALYAMTSETNRAPLAPHVSSTSVQTLTAKFPHLRWDASLDPEGDITSFIVRLDDDGEILTDWKWQFETAPGVPQLHVTDGLPLEHTYHFAVRARDTSGALSEWSQLGSLEVTAAQPVSVGGKDVPSLRDALPSARAGDVITLGKGRFMLESMATVPAGVRLQGAGAGQTLLDAGHLPVGVTLMGTAQSRGRVSGVTVAGADIAVDVPAGQSVDLDHVVIRDAKSIGLRVGAAANAAVVHATLVRNGTALWSAGSTSVVNSLIMLNASGLVTDGAGTLTNSYSNLFGNQVDVQGKAVHSNGVAAHVEFVDAARDDFHVLPGQLTTDQGDPASAFDLEPMPNGARANLGAYGNTADAEVTVLPPVDSPTEPETPGEEPAPPLPEPPLPQPEVQVRAPSGCSLSGKSGEIPGWMGLAGLVCLAMRRRRRSKSR